MSDVFIPPARFPASGGAPAATSGVAATVTHPPPATAELATGAILRGTVLGTDARGQVLVRTDYGLLALQTQAQLAKGSQVTLQVRVAGTELHVVILKVQPEDKVLARQQQSGEQPLPEAATSRNPRASGGAPGSTSAEPLDELAQGRPLRAVVVTLAAPPSTAGAGAAIPADLRPGAAVEIRILEVRPPTGPGPTAPATGASAPAGKPDSAAAPATAGTSGTGSPAAAPQASAAQPASPQPSVQGSPPPGGAGTAPGSTIEGVVVRTGGSEATVIQTPFGTLRLDAKAALTPGTRLAFEIAGPARPAPAAVEEVAAARGASLARGWPALAESLEVLQMANTSAVAMSLGTHALPRPGPRLASTVMFFLAALKGGDLSVWLSGQTAQALERAGRSDLVAHLKQDFARMSRLAAEPAPGEWRAFLVPVLDDGALHQVRFFLRRPEADEGTGDRPERPRATRFLVEVSLSRFGDLQFDGLIQQRRFDLILRSRGPLPEIMQQDIRRIFEAAGETTGYRGQLVFRTGADWDLMPLSAMTADEPDMVV